MWLWFSAAVIVLLTEAAVLTQFDRVHRQLEAAVRRQDSTVDQATIDRVADVSLILLIGLAALLAIIVLLFAAMMQRGRGWARWCLVIVAVLLGGYGFAVVSGLNDLGGLGDVVTGGLLLYSVTSLAGCAAMFSPPARPWFARGKLGPS
ncbi:MAG: hypothetical protein ACRDPW_07310 [Mycobacteriales bacterium]